MLVYEVMQDLNLQQYLRYKDLKYGSLLLGMVHDGVTLGMQGLQYQGSIRSALDLRLLLAFFRRAASWAILSLLFEDFLGIGATRFPNNGTEHSRCWPEDWVCVSTKGRQMELTPETLPGFFE